MKVKELIENLSHQDPDTEVFFLADDTLIIEDDLLALCEVRNIQPKQRLYLKDIVFVDESTLRGMLSVESALEYEEDDPVIDKQVEETPFLEGIIVGITAAREGCK
jgi:hypothetical protein